MVEAESGSTGSKTDLKSSLTTKVGPLPVWSYGVILGGFVAGIYLLKRRKGNSSLPISTVTSTNPASNGSFGSGGGGSSAGSGSGSSPTPTTGDANYPPGTIKPGDSTPPVNTPPATTPPDNVPYNPQNPSYPIDPTPVIPIGPTNGGASWDFSGGGIPRNYTGPYQYPYGSPGYIPPEVIVPPLRPDSYVPGSGGAMGSRTYAVNN